MKRRVLAVLLALCMCVGLLPATALADGEANGTPESEITCICDTKCAEENWNEDCPVCKDGYELCAAPGDTEEEEPSAPSETPEDPLELEEETSEEPTPVPPANNSLTAEEEPIALNEAEPAAASTIYVSAVGSDENPGTADKPYATLSKAVDAAQDGDTICLLSDLEIDRLALISGKVITIDGQDHIVTRAEDFKSKTDQGRGGYHPAMIEVANQSTLTLTNITLDDQFLRKAKEFTLAGSSTENNLAKVHDGIIASYGDGHSTIILGEGTTLKNFGGLSAVYITGENGEGATLIMKSGSKICDDKLNEREGGYAAIFNHGGTVNAETGSSIESIDGRAIYADNGGVTTFAGSIKEITSSEAVKQAGDAGVAYYGDGHTVFTLASGGLIEGIKSHDGTAADSALHLISCTFKTEKNSYIQNLSVGVADMNGATVDLAGSITNCGAKDVFFRLRGTQGTFILQETGSITKCNADTALIYLNGGKPTVTIAGTIDDINATALFMSNNGSNKGGVVTLTETGVITNITGYGMRLEDPSRVTVAGTITNCSSYAVQYYPKSNQSLLMIKSIATIENNNGSGAQVRAQNTLPATNAQEHIVIEPGGLDGNKTIDMAIGGVTLDEDYAEISLGNASSDVQTALEEKVPNNWTQVGGGLWFRPAESSLHFTLDPTASVANDKAIYAVYAPVNADGTALTEDAQATMVALKNQKPLDITLGNLTPDQSYALILVQPDENYGTLTLSGTETITQASTPVNYTAKFTASSTLATQIGTNKEFTLTIALDENLTYTDGLTVASSAFKQGVVTYDESTHTISVPLTASTLQAGSTFTVSFSAALRSGGFHDGGRLVTSANLQTEITVENIKTNVMIPSNVVVTNMTAPTQPVDPGTGGGGTGSDKSDPYLRFDSNGGTAFDPIDGHGSAFTINPYDDDEYGTHIPSRPGYRFTGWYRDSRLTMRVDEDTALRITNSVTLFAGWTETSVPSMLNGDDHYAYIQGYADGTVRPNANITRAQVATIFFRLLDEDVREDYLTTSNAFPDVSEDYWANTAISTMARLGVINGRNSGNFDPNAYITRAEFAAICARFDDSGVTSVSTFTDTDGHWAEEEISRAAALGWIQGYSDGTFRPNQYITRAQAVTMINRVLCRLPEDEDDLLSGMNTWTDCHEGDWYYLAIQEATNSHDFDAKDQVYEIWTDLNADPDWSRYE